MSDFPAAHSMDTTWFAIDADGYVGIFDSGAEGAVPKDLTKIESDCIDFKSELFEVLNQNKYMENQNISSVNLEDVVKDSNLEFLKDKIGQYERLDSFESNIDWGLLEHLVLELSNQLAIEDLKKQANLILRFEGKRIVVYVDKCDRKWLKKAIRSKKVLAGKEAMVEYNLSWLGWYEYATDASIPMPYDRKYRVNKPIHFDDLSPEIRDRLRITELPNIQFAETASIQPIEHMPCRTWSGWEYWIDTNGVEHDRFPEYLNEE